MARPRRRWTRSGRAAAGSPLADYAIGGAEGTVGLAGVLGVIVTLAVAGGLFWLLRRRSAGD